MYFSIIVAVYLRKDEVVEFLDSLKKQKYDKFEVILADGSPNEDLLPVSEPYKAFFPVTHLHERNLGISESRNWGCENAKGDFVVFIDSDCVIPENYFNNIVSFLEKHPDVKAFGGPDAAHESFSPVMKAINYAMTSLFTTGGIRGRKNHVGKFLMRGFNMGVSSTVHRDLGGFSGMKVAEDIEYSVRIIKAGHQTALIPDAYVYHKRRSNFKKFVKQVHMFGKGRVDLYMRHPEQLKLVHLMPTGFAFFTIAAILLSVFFPLVGGVMGGLVGIYLLAMFLDATVMYKNPIHGALAVYASVLMLFSYGTGLAKNLFRRVVLGQKTDSKKADHLKV